MPHKVLACYKHLLFVCLLCSAFLLSSCDPEENNIGLDIIPSGSFIPKRDTLYTTTYSCYQDSIVSGSFGDTEGNWIGCVFDPLFGKTSSSLAVSFGLSTEDPQFDRNAAVDSVVLSLTLDSDYYGDALSTQTFRIFELTDTLSSPYYSHIRCPHSNFELASKTFVPSFDSLTVGGSLVEASLQFKLDNSIGQRIIDADSLSLSNNDEFIKFFNGLYITPDQVNTPGSGVLLNFLLSEDQTYLKVYYHNDSVQSLSFSLKVTDSQQRKMEFEHYNYNDASPELLSAIGDSAIGCDKLYLQSMAGVRAKIKINGLDSIAALGNIAVSNAVLTFFVDKDESFFTIPSSFDLVQINDDGSTTSIADYSNGSSLYDGNYSATKGTISFRIQSQLQQLFFGNRKNTDYYLVIRYSNFLPGRMVLFGSSPSDISKRINVDMTYSIVLPE